MKETLITVFTPTFNRGGLLKKLYNSLVIQKYTSFEWLIYDDGSTDNTLELVEKFIKDNKITIRYFYYNNSGKHVAINNGVELANGELFFIVDSDDFLADNALSKINYFWKTIPEEDKDSFIGVGGKRYLINKENKDFNFKSEFHDADAITFNLIEKNIQDKAEVYVTKKLRNYKFPQIEGEKFMTECVVWYKIAEDGFKIRWFNEYIYNCEYIKGGLTDTFYYQRVNSPKSTCISYDLLASYSLPISYKLRYRVNYYRYGLHNDCLENLKLNSSTNKFQNLIALVGLIMYFNDKRKRVV